jgi:glycosyltransferase involved in cell wall biosynthesis
MLEASMQASVGADIPRSLAIRTKFAHHAEASGYRQILRYTRPVAEVGVDERSGKPPRWPYRNHHWLYEFNAAWLAHRLRVDVVHVLYAENYYRFLKTLCSAIPVVVTFHQPPDLLASELRDGASRGRLAGMTHRLTSGRFAKVAAAIITSECQRACLAEYVEPSKIHYIPLGVAAHELMEFGGGIDPPCEPQKILTVGNWKRNWQLYFDVVRACERARPSWRFTLINRQLTQPWRDVARGLGNLVFLSGVSDSDLYAAYKTSSVQFLPLLGAAGNNAVNESLAFGCPVVSNIDLGFGPDASGVVAVTSGGSIETLIESIERFVLVSEAGRRDLRDASRRSILARDWSVIASRTMDIYKSVA